MEIDVDHSTKLAKNNDMKVVRPLTLSLSLFRKKKQKKTIHEDNKKSFIERSPWDVVANVLDCDCVICQFKLQSF